MPPTTQLPRNPSAHKATSLEGNTFIAMTSPPSLTQELQCTCSIWPTGLQGKCHDERCLYPYATFCSCEVILRRGRALIATDISVQPTISVSAQIVPAIKETVKKILWLLGNWVEPKVWMLDTSPWPVDYRGTFISMKILSSPCSAVAREYGGHFA